MNAVHIGGVQLAALAVLAGIAAVVALEAPEIRRYLKIARM
jgi:hypothetical protein